MHMSDALVSPPVAIAMGAVSVICLMASIVRVKKQAEHRSIPLMGVMGAFVFAAQMINFTIPGTGSSGHIVGGILLSALLGPWRALITLASVLTIQCLIFADGGLLALGCNVFNMGVCSCLIAYPLVFRPIMRHKVSASQLTWASVLSCVVALELGALMVSLETYLSGISALPLSRFLLFMLPIHAVIGLCEGAATAGVLGFVHRFLPESTDGPSLREPLVAVGGASAEGENRAKGYRLRSKGLWLFLAAALLMAGSFYWVASSQPDGLEWSIWQTTDETTITAPAAEESLQAITESIQRTTAVLPDYNRATDGIIGVILVIIALWAGLSLLLGFRRKDEQAGKSDI